MRWLAVALLVPLSGCLAGLANELIACPDPASHVLVQDYDLLVPSDSPVQFGERARLEFATNRTQHVSAMVVWQSSYGLASLRFDGANGTESHVGPTWSWMGKLPPGNYSIEVAGDPAAINTSVVISVLVSGC